MIIDLAAAVAAHPEWAQDLNTIEKIHAWTAEILGEAAAGEVFIPSIGAIRENVIRSTETLDGNGVNRLFVYSALETDVTYRGTAFPRWMATKSISALIVPARYYTATI